MKFFLCIVLFYSQVFADDSLIEKRYDPIKNLQQKDGSIGTEHPEVLTSIALFAMLSNAETPTSKRHGECVQKMIAYLIDSSKRLRKEEVSIKHLYVLWALSETFRMVGEEGVEEAVEPLYRYIIDKCFKDERPSFGALISSDCMFMMVRSLRSYVSTKLPVLPTKDMMGSYALHCLSKLGYKRDVSLALHFITKLWDIDNIFEYKGIAISEEELTEVKDGLNNSSSKIRKEYFSYCRQLNAGKLKYLTDELEKSPVTEHQQVAKDLRSKARGEFVFRTTISDYSKCDANLLNLYFSYAYTQCRHHMKTIHNEVQLSFYPDKGFGFDKLDIKLPKILDSMSDEEHKVSLYCFALEMTFFHRNVKPDNSKKWDKLQLLPSEMNVVEEPPPLMEEEGLDLIE